MVRHIVSATVSAALCLATAAPAFAQSYNTSEVQAPLGATGMVNLRIPLGPSARTEAPSYGLTLGMGQAGGMDANARLLTREVRVADVRFNFDGSLRHANVASFDLANLDQDRRFDGLTGGIDTMWLVVGIAAGAVAVCVLADCFDGDDENDPA
jgi:hypothetical protein